MKQNHHYDALKHLLTQALRHSDGVVVVELSAEPVDPHADHTVGMGHMGCGCPVCRAATIEATRGPGTMQALSVKRQAASERNQPEKRIIVETV